MKRIDAFLVGMLIGALVLTWAESAESAETDKQAHAAGSAVISLAVAPLLADSERPVFYPFAVSFSAGVLKEIYDARHGGTGFDKNDLVADALGAIVGAITGNAVYVFAVNHGVGVGVRGKFITSKQEGEK